MYILINYIYDVMSYCKRFIDKILEKENYIIF
jgi:hypothetical protein